MTSSVHPETYGYFYNGYLSQFHKSPFTVDEYTYNCGEQAMMHQKALLFDDLVTAQKILVETKPASIKRLGRQVKHFNNITWNNNKINIVYINNLAKFTQNTELKERLCKTVPNILVEAAANDRIWGIGYNEYNAKKVDVSSWGENLLGQILTKVRTDIITDT